VELDPTQPAFFKECILSAIAANEHGAEIPLCFIINEASRVFRANLSDGHGHRSFWDNCQSRIPLHMA